MYSGRLIAAAAVLCFSSCTAQCPDNGIQPDSGIYNGVCGVDPSDNTDLAIGQAICANGNNEVYTLQSSTSLASATTYQEFNFNFNEANTAIDAGTPVTLQYIYEGQYYGSISFTTSPVTSNYYTAATTTVTSVTVTEEATTTSTVTATSTSVIPQQTSTTPCTTGTATITSSSTTTSTLVVTPKPRTVCKNTVKTSTTSISCLGRQSPSKPRRNVELAARVAAVAYEVPYCPSASGAPTPTTYITGTSTVAGTTTTTETDTSFATTTETTTVTPTPLTTTVCSNVQGTTTTVGVVTNTSVSVARQSTITSTKTYTVTKTVFPHGKLTCCPAPKPVKHGSGGKTIEPTKKASR